MTTRRDNRYLSCFLVMRLASPQGRPFLFSSAWSGARRRRSAAVLAQTAGSEAARRAYSPEFAPEKFRKKIHQIFKYPKFFVYLLYNQKQKNMTLQPINPQELRSRLNVGTVQFAFKKLDGTLRTAIGTTCLEQVPLDNHPKGAGSSPKIIPFFDLQKGEWRSVSVGREIFIQE